jgi:YgiT-type zinc finger domain-containing protein
MENEASIQHGLMCELGGHKESTMHEYGDCSLCGSEVKEEFVGLDYRYKKQLYIFRDVPTGVCQQCGEKYLVASTAKAIEAIHTKKDWPETVNVPVTMFCNVAVV